MTTDKKKKKKRSLSSQSPTISTNLLSGNIGTSSFHSRSSNASSPSSINGGGDSHPNITITLPTSLSNSSPNSSSISIDIHAPRSSSCSCPHILKPSFPREAILQYFHDLINPEKKKSLSIKDSIDSSIKQDLNYYLTMELNELEKGPPILLMDLQLHHCLHCVFKGALYTYQPSKNGFIKHFFQTDHFLAMHLERKMLYCALCEDYVYDETFSKEFQRKQVQNQLNLDESKYPPDQLGRKRKRHGIDSWLKTLGAPHYQNISTNLTKENLLQHSSKLSHVSESLFIKAMKEKGVGLKGLYNMGNTCFMSCILQCLVHNPMIRNYFLADSHNAKQCKRKRDSQIIVQRKIQGTLKPQYCFGCDMDEFMSMMYDLPNIKKMEMEQSIEALVPHKFLYSMWHHSQHLAGYDQQDAHEFLMFLLDGIHSHTHRNVSLGGSSPRIGAKGMSLCDCVVHQTFSGVLRSDITCTTCHGISSAYDPFFDLSLSLDSQLSTSSSLNFNMNSTNLHLFDILDKFTHSEHLTAAERVRCQNCGDFQDSMKKLSILSLPNVLTIHLKRFNALTQSKINDYIEFPAHELDIKKYMYREYKSTPKTPEKTASSCSSFLHSDCSLYDLFAVVNHHGNMSGGHYTCYTRVLHSWYKFDDAWVTQVDEQQVLKSEAYILFYIRRNLGYKTS